jgi:ABC-type Fe3+ transport system permease subunit
MESHIAGIITVVALCAWHLRTRRHPGWSVSADARFYITAAYPSVAIAVFWLVESTTTTSWEWVIGNVWALVAMISFVYGFDALNAASAQRRSVSRALESIDPSEDHSMPNPARPRHRDWAPRG